MPKKRLRIFAGPNGSGKSTIFKYVDKNIGCKYFVNADEIQHELSSKGVLSFDKYTICVDKDSFMHVLTSSSWYNMLSHRDELLQSVDIVNNRLKVPTEYVDGYFSAFVAEFIRQNMLNIVQQFTIETVLSDPRKIDYIRHAKELGYRIYLYFVSTKDVEINIKRVAQRVLLGGHDVPADKIKKRYNKSIDNLYDVLKLCDRAYIFDNSEDNWLLLAEYDSGTLTVNQEMVPAWFHDKILSKLEQQ